MFYKLKQRFHEWLCKRRGKHLWVQRCYGGLGGSYHVTVCKCCDLEKPKSFIPEWTCS